MVVWGLKKQKPVISDHRLANYWNKWNFNHSLCCFFCPLRCSHQWYIKQQEKSKIHAFRQWFLLHFWVFLLYKRINAQNSACWSNVPLNGLEKVINDSLSFYQRAVSPSIERNVLDCWIFDEASLLHTLLYENEIDVVSNYFYCHSLSHSSRVPFVSKR